MSLAFRWTPFSSHPRSTSVFSFRPFPFHGIPISFIKNSLFRVYLSSRHRISAGLPRTAHLPSSVAEIYFNLPAVKACQFLPSPLISVLYNSIQSRPFVCLLRLFSSLLLPFFFYRRSSLAFCPLSLPRRRRRRRLLRRTVFSSARFPETNRRPLNIDFPLYIYKVTRTTQYLHRGRFHAQRQVEFVE